MDLLKFLNAFADNISVKVIKEYILMDKYWWPGAYSFKFELKTLLECAKEQIDIILSKIEKADKMAQIQNCAQI